MKELILIDRGGVFYADSREVADMTEARHADLLEKIKTYIQYMLNGEFRSTDFFVEDSYVDGLNREQPRYLLTKEGCDMIANKMTGERGVLFTAAYVKRFKEMELSIKTDISGLSPILQTLIQTEQRQKALEARQLKSEEQVEVIKETFLDRDENWRSKMNGLLAGAARRHGGDYQEIRKESYDRLEDRGRCDLTRRLNNMKDRAFESGASKTAIDKMNRMDVIEADPKLKEIYSIIVKELSLSRI